MLWAALTALFAPFLGMLINGLFGTFFKRKAHWVAVPALGVSAAAASYLLWLFATGAQPAEFNLYTWMLAGRLEVPFGLYLDQLSAVMAFTVTFVSFLIHVYSVGYMGHDPGFRRFFTYLNLFVFFMLLLVLSNSSLLMFVGWEGVGLASYLLIGFWYERLSASNAGKKAFIVNRIGDAGFLLAIFTLFAHFGTLRFSELAHLAHSAPHWLLTAIALLLFVGAVGKSAQFPLYVWLPDAMEGPTPVSALIHAATMVTAGVYMVARSNFIYSQAPEASLLVASVGAFTAIFAASMALVNNDIKRILAYSTISQLGYMFMGVGLGAYAAGIFHLFTHAFFKALLFLGAGSVMHAMHDVLDIRRMGGLAKKLPQTAAVFTVGSLALAGIPPFAGFFSKDAILHAAHSGGHTLIWLVGTITAFMTAFYMFRAVFMVFTGKPRDRELYEGAHESPPVMTVPMWVLALGATLLGFVQGWFNHLLEPVWVHHHAHEPASLNLLLISVGAAGLGLLVAAFMYWRPGFRSELLAKLLRPLYVVLYRKYWVDEIYNALVVKPLWFLSAYPLYRGLDTWVIDRGLVDGTGYLFKGAGALARAFQRGNLRRYALFIVLGALAVFYLVILGGK